jgi:hypothetical protein
VAFRPEVDIDDVESHSNLVGSGPVSHEEISNAARVNATARMPPQ